MKSLTSLNFSTKNKIDKKSLFSKQTKWGLGLICLFILTSCTKSEGAKAEAFLFNMLSMMGLMAVEVALVIIVVMTMLLRQNDNYLSLIHI